MKVKAEITIRFDDQDIDDIMSSAFEGGITYWCDRAEVIGRLLGRFASDQISRNGAVKLHVMEPFEENRGKEVEEYVLTKDLFIEGIKRSVEHGYSGFLDEDENTGDMVLDACSIDAALADTIVQYALFGDVIYG